MMQNNKLLHFLFSLMLLTTVSFSKASEVNHTENNPTTNQKEQTEISAYIKHHLLDSYDFTLYSDEKTGNSLGFPLPVILWDNGLQFFSSSKFQHGQAVAENNGNYYKIHHGKIYKTDKEGIITEKATKEGQLHPTNIKPLDFSITKNVFVLFLAMTLLILAFVKMAKNYQSSPIPKGLGRFLEPMVLFVKEDIVEDNINTKKAAKFTPLLLTLFFFILILNLLGLTPLGINVTGNITTTFFLSLLVYLVVQFSANLDYWKHIFWMPDVPIVMKLILCPIELLGTLTKPFALMMRLFANMSAGHIVIMTLISLIYITKSFLATVGFPLLTLAISFIELFVAFLQAYVFTMLASLFIGQAVEEHAHH